jgi:murein DD-endopeptidase MepM/ murein hydrolase activator NlpD
MLHPTRNIGTISSPFGMRWGAMHWGTDIAVPQGTAVYAVAGGVVNRIDDTCFDNHHSCGGGFGNHVSIDHENDIFTNYAHLSQVNVRTGQRLKAGDLIGYSGNTGHSYGAHLHFEIRKGGWLSHTALDPYPYLTGQAELPASPVLYVAKHSPKYVILGVSAVAVGLAVWQLTK